jgi:hypothetical protein
MQLIVCSNTLVQANCSRIIQLNYGIKGANNIPLVEHISITLLTDSAKLLVYNMLYTSFIQPQKVVVKMQY